MCQWKVRRSEIEELVIEYKDFSSAMTQFFYDAERRAKSAMRWMKWGGNREPEEEEEETINTTAMEAIQGENEWVGEREEKRQAWSSLVKVFGLEWYVHTNKGRGGMKEKVGWDVLDNLNVLFLPPCFVLMPVLWFVSPWRSYCCRSKCCLSIKGALWERLAVSPEIHVVSSQWLNLVSTFLLLLSA